MKVSPVSKAMAEFGRLKPYLVHTGQHYDEKMSKSFLHLLHITTPNIGLGVGSGSHAE